jgi:transposase
MQLSIGIDWADKSHAVCIREISTRRSLVEFTISNDAAGVERMEDRLKALGVEPEECVVAIETTQGLLFNYLVGAGYPVHPVPPARVESYRKRHRQSGAKTDEDDARILADILCVDLSLFPPVAADSPLVREIRAVSRGRRQLVKQRTRLINQLKNNLKAYFPAALGLFGLNTLIMHAFLLAYPTHQAVRQATDDQLVAFLKEQGYKRPDKIPAILDKLRAPSVPVPDWQAQAAQPLTEAFLAQLAVVRKHILNYERTLKRLLDAHPDTPIFSSLPGVGFVITAGLLSEIGDCRTRFLQAANLQALAGSAPVTRQSGPSRSVLFRYACNKHLRYFAQQLARASSRPGKSSWARAYLADQLARGHKSSRAYRALANRWLKIVFRMWQDRTLYDENFHLQNIATRGNKQQHYLHSLDTYKIA